MLNPHKHTHTQKREDFLLISNRKVINQTNVFNKLKIIKLNYETERKKVRPLKR
jgi:hypothetical protein